MGTGVTAGALLNYPGLTHRVCAELLPSVALAAPLFKGNFGAGTSNSQIDPRLRDGRRELLRSSERYDLITQNDEDSRSLVRSFLDSFPYASLWTTEIHEMLLIGSSQPIELNVPRIAARFYYPAVNDALAEVGIASPGALLATWITGREGLERYAGQSPP